MNATQLNSAANDYDRNNRDSSGKLYMPSMKFGVTTAAPNGAVSSSGGPTKAWAITHASDWTLREKGRRATVFRRTNPACKMISHFWNDGQQQSINY